MCDSEHECLQKFKKKMRFCKKYTSKNMRVNVVETTGHINYFKNFNANLECLQNEKKARNHPPSNWL